MNTYIKINISQDPYCHLKYLSNFSNLKILRVSNYQEIVGFEEIYNLDVVEVPTARELIRKDLPDLVYQTELSKWKSVLNQTKNCYKTGQPVLIGTASVEKSEFLSDLFNVTKIAHQVLNAKPENLLRENEIKYLHIGISLIWYSYQ